MFVVQTVASSLRFPAAYTSTVSRDEVDVAFAEPGGRGQSSGGGGEGISDEHFLFRALILASLGACSPFFPSSIIFLGRAAASLRPT